MPPLSSTISRNQGIEQSGRRPKQKEMAAEQGFKQLSTSRYLFARQLAKGVSSSSTLVLKFKLN
jgi:hypothetical protein